MLAPMCIELKLKNLSSDVGLKPADPATQTFEASEAEKFEYFWF